MVDGRYHVVRRLGEGSQAAVLATFDRKLGVGRALKALRPHLAAQPRTRTRFEDEGRTLALVEHPNVVRVYDVATSGRTIYLVLEHVGGGSLLDRVLRVGPLPPDVAVRRLSEVCSGLAVAHARGIVHRDIKPQNLLLGLDGTVKLADFGIARTATGNHTVASAPMGTLGFVAPEQLADARSVDGRADVYSLGMTLFVLVTGASPEVWLRERRHPRLPAALARVIERATEEATYARHPNVRELAAELEACLQELPTSSGTRLDARAPAPVREDPEWTSLEELATWFGRSAHLEPLPRSAPPPARTPPAPPRRSVVREPPRPASRAERAAAAALPEPAAARSAQRRRGLLDTLAAASWLLAGPIVAVAAGTTLATWLATRGGPDGDELRARLDGHREIAASLTSAGADPERVTGLFQAWERAGDEASRQRIEDLISTELVREARRVLADQPLRRLRVEAQVHALDREAMAIASTAD